VSSVAGPGEYHVTFVSSVGGAVKKPNRRDFYGEGDEEGIIAISVTMYKTDTRR